MMLLISILAAAAILFTLKELAKASVLQNYFSVDCPVCGEKRYWSKIIALDRIATLTIDEIAAIKFICAKFDWTTERNREDGGCGADLTPYYISSPFVREHLQGREHINLERERTKAYIQALKDEVFHVAP